MALLNLAAYVAEASTCCTTSLRTPYTTARHLRLPALPPPAAARATSAALMLLQRHRCINLFCSCLVHTRRGATRGTAAPAVTAFHHHHHHHAYTLPHARGRHNAPQALFAAHDAHAAAWRGGSSIPGRRILMFRHLRASLLPASCATSSLLSWWLSCLNLTSALKPPLLTHYQPAHYGASGLHIPYLLAFISYYGRTFLPLPSFIFAGTQHTLPLPPCLPVPVTASLLTLWLAAVGSLTCLFCLLCLLLSCLPSPAIPHLLLPHAGMARSWRYVIS